MATFKTCTSCDKSKPYTLEYFHSRNSNGKKALRACCKKCTSLMMKARSAEVKKKVAIYAQRHRYNLSQKEYLKFMAVTNCHCCNTTFIERKDKRNPRCIDHDHTTGIIRGVLCNGCNTAIGKLGDSVEGLYKAINYLKFTPWQHLQN